MQDLLIRIQKADKMKTSLKRSIADSRNNSKNNSPSTSLKTKRTSRPTQPKKTDTRIVQQRGNSGKRKNTTDRRNNKENHSEYEDTLNSFLKLKQGNNSEYSELVLNALEATNNILTLKNSRKQSKSPVRKEKHDKKPTGKVDINELIQFLNERSVNANQKNKSPKNNTVIDTLVNAMEQLSINPEENKREAITPEQTEELMQQLKAVKHKQKETIHTTIQALANTETIDLDQAQHNSEERKEDRKKKLVSGKCAKPDESDIKHSAFPPREVRCKTCQK